MRGMLDEPGCRCIYCYRTRMRYAARYAKENGYDAFSTTLLVSPYQKHELIKKLAEEAAAEFDIPFYYEDFREGYQRGVDISLELELYRQPYCGCVFSERDRYEKKPKRKINARRQPMRILYSALLFMMMLVGTPAALAAPQISVGLVTGQFTAELASETDFTAQTVVNGSVRKEFLFKAGSYYFNAANGSVNADGQEFGNVVLRIKADGVNPVKVNKKLIAAI